VLGLYFEQCSRESCPLSSPPTQHSVPDQTAVSESGRGHVGSVVDDQPCPFRIVARTGVQTLPKSGDPPHTIIVLPSRLPCDRFGPWARWWCDALSNYSCWDCTPTGVKVTSVPATPHHHLAASPDRRVKSRAEVVRCGAHGVQLSVRGCISHRV